MMIKKEMNLVVVIIICLLLIVQFSYVDGRIGGRIIGGVYNYVNKKTGKSHYVGATKDFDRRHKEHKADGKYYAAEGYEMKKKPMTGGAEKRYAEEKKQIEKHKPVANKYKGGNGRR